MILLVHMIFGAAIGYKVFALTQSPFLAAAAALLSHYFLDWFPHIEYLRDAEKFGSKIKNKPLKYYAEDLLKVLVDLIGGLILVDLVAVGQFSIYFFAFLAIVPDGLTVVNSLIDHPWLKKHQELHGEKLQHKNEKFSLFWRITTQVAAFFISLFLFVSY